MYVGLIKEKFTRNDDATSSLNKGSVNSSVQFSLVILL